MRILFLGDIVGRAGREAVAKHLPVIREKLSPDVVIINGENAAHGMGITDKICKELFDLGTDVITLGNHAWDKRDIMLYIDREPRLVRPMNFPDGTPGKGHCLHALPDGRKILVVNAMARLFMDPLDDPFAAMKKLCGEYRLGQNVNAIFLDFHGETTSEKTAMANYLDGQISCLVGTHTHVPTADHRILPDGTAMQCDAGMCGDYDSIIGMQKEVPISRFTRKISMGHLQPAEGEGTVSGLFVVTNDQTGKAISVAPVRQGPHLAETLPDF